MLYELHCNLSIPKNATPKHETMVLKTQVDIKGGIYIKGWCSNIGAKHVEDEYF